MFWGLVLCVRCLLFGVLCVMWVFGLLFVLDGWFVWVWIGGLVGCLVSLFGCYMLWVLVFSLALDIRHYNV